MRAALRPALVALALFTLLLGGVYPLLVTGIARVMPHRTPEVMGKPVEDPRYFWGRPSAVAGVVAAASSGTNLGPSQLGARGAIVPNEALTAKARARIAALHAADPGNPAPVPVDLVTASASGLDPHISPAAARYQVARIARLRGRPVAEIQALVDAYTEGRTLGILGAPRVDVLRLNRALDAPPHG